MMVFGAVFGLGVALTLSRLVSGLLSRLQPDLIKIDMELLRDIHLSRAKQAIVAGIVGIARTLDIHVLAEGVESDEELTVLRAAGISLFQGYHFAKPALMALPDVPLLSAAVADRRVG